MAEESITCDTFDRLELPPGPAIRIALEVNSSSGIPVMGSCRHCKDFFGRYASSVCNDKVNSKFKTQDPKLKNFLALQDEP